MGKTKKVETKIDDIQKLSHENLISQLINSNFHYVNLRSIVFIPMSFEIREKIDLTLFGVVDGCYDIYQCCNCTLITESLQIIDAFVMLYCYSHANKAQCCCCCIRTSPFFYLFFARLLFVNDFVALLRSTKRILFKSFFSPAVIDRGCQVTSDFRRHFELTDTLGRDLMLVSIRCQTR